MPLYPMVPGSISCLELFLGMSCFQDALWKLTEQAVLALADMSWHV